MEPVGAFSRGEEEEEEVGVGGHADRQLVSLRLTKWAGQIRAASLRVFGMAAVHN